MKYIKRKDGEGWSVKNRIPFRIGCCDCGLVHDLVLHVRGRRKGFIVGIAAERNERATSAKRRVARKIADNTPRSANEPSQEEWQETVLQILHEDLRGLDIGQDYRVRLQANPPSTGGI